MLAIRKIIKRDEFETLHVPESFGEELEIIILPYKSDSDKVWAWDPDEAEFSRFQHKLNIEAIDKEYGAEDIDKWKE